MLTGGRPEKVTVNNWKGKDAFEETSSDLWHKLLTYHTEGHMMGAAICSGKEMPDKYALLALKWLVIYSKQDHRTCSWPCLWCT